MEKKIKILMLEDNPDDVTLIERLLKKDGMEFASQCVDTREEFLAALPQFQPDVILSDHGLPAFNSMEALRLCQRENLHVPFILVTGTVSEEFAISIIKKGADDYILKTNLSRLPLAIRRAIKERKLEYLKRDARRALRRQNHELQKVNEELDRFVYSVSHNLRGPLASVLGLLDLAISNDQERKLLNLHSMMRTSIGRLNVTLNEILDYTHNSRKEIEYREIRWNNLVDEVFDKAELLHTSEGHTYRSYHLNTSVPFYSDPERIRVILNNLITNALQFRSPSRDLTVEIGITTSGAGANIVIQDNGSGIHPDSLPKIFEMFYRGSERSHGAGLGLYIVREVVLKLGGTIEVDSAYNRGSQFIVVLPNQGQ